MDHGRSLLDRHRDFGNGSRAAHHGTSRHIKVLVRLPRVSRHATEQLRHWPLSAINSRQQLRQVAYTGAGRSMTSSARAAPNWRPAPGRAACTARSADGAIETVLGSRGEPIDQQSHCFSRNRVQVAHLEVARVSCRYHCDARPAQGIASAGDMEILGDNHCARQPALLHDRCAVLCPGLRGIPIFIEDDSLARHLFWPAR